MKQSILLCCIAALAVLAACVGKKEEAHDHDHEHVTADTAMAKEEWKEMDDFHMVMAESFHPYKDSANLEPARAKAPDMAAAAEKWAGAELPARVKDNADVKANLEKLKTGTAAFVETVKAGEPTAIAKSLTELHDLFHAIQEQWYGGHGHHH